MKKYNRLGGWLLLLFVINVIIIAVNFVNMVSIITRLEGIYIIAFILSLVLISIFSYYCYILLNPSPQTYSKIRWILIAIAVVSTMNVILTSTTYQDATIYLIQSAIYVSINYLLWSMYFKRSSRVVDYFGL